MKPPRPPLAAVTSSKRTPKWAQWLLIVTLVDLVLGLVILAYFHGALA